MIEEKEFWVAGKGEGALGLIAALDMRFWRVNDRPSRGKIRSHQDTPGGRSFEQYWEILES